MKRVVIASENPVKVAVAEKAFKGVFPDEVFEFVAIKSQSGVPEQPMNDETKQGAFNRLQYIQEQYPGADYWISQEGGAYEEDARIYNRAWIAVTDKSNYIAASSTAQFYVPTKIVSLLREGLELGHATDEFFKSVNSKHGVGAIGHLTDGLIDREIYYLQAAIIALSELKHKEWYQ